MRITPTTSASSSSRSGCSAASTPGGGRLPRGRGGRLRDPAQGEPAAQGAAARPWRSRQRGVLEPRAHLQETLVTTQRMVEEMKLAASARRTSSCARPSCAAKRRWRRPAARRPLRVEIQALRRLRRQAAEEVACHARALPAAAPRRGRGRPGRAVLIGCLRGGVVGEGGPAARAHPAPGGAQRDRGLASRRHAQRARRGAAGGGTGQRGAGRPAGRLAPAAPLRRDELAHGARAVTSSCASAA